MSNSDKEFEEFVDKHKETFGAIVPDYRWGAEEAWNHQQKKIDELTEQLTRLSEQCSDLYERCVKKDRQITELRERLNEQCRWGIEETKEKERQEGLKRVYENNLKDARKKIRELENKSHNYHCKESQRKNDVIQTLEALLIEACERGGKILKEEAEINERERKKAGLKDGEFIISGNFSKNQAYYEFDNFLRKPEIKKLLNKGE